jgi:beta-mannosidase
MAREEISLRGAWTFESKEHGICGTGQVPGCIHLDLMEAGFLQDPHIGNQELDQFWVGQATWTYFRSFDLGEEILRNARVELICEGIDTLSDIELNGIHIGSTNNQHRTWSFDIRKSAKPGSNTIKIVLHSVYPEIERMKAIRPLVGNGSNSFCIDGGQYLRKSACNFGWDWGPKCLTAGIWRDISIRVAQCARIDDLHVRQTHKNGQVTLELSASVSPGFSDVCTLEFEVLSPNGELLTTHAKVFASKASSKIRITNPELWWPSGYGNQPLYRVRADLRNTRTGEIQDTRQKRIGLRTIQLDQSRDTHGYSFGFVVNRQPVFALGANWIPADTFVTRVDAAKLRNLLESAKKANMNMLRVWGGGIYECDTFYDLCDELGLLVWQDFLFACHAYPAYDAEWMENVRAEATQAVKRLGHHACMALWCGNNELRHMSAVVNDAGDQGAMSWKEYDLLFDKLLRRITKSIVPDTPYIDGSPCKRKSVKYGPHDDSAGDLHYWMVWWGLLPFEAFRSVAPRFCSEFGFQSYPHPSTIAEFTAPTERHLSSYTLDFHQRGSTCAGDGNSTILSYVASWFRLPPVFDDAVVVTQLCQAMAIKSAAEYWRFSQPRCQGILYWQLNDCWPGQSWSSIDSAGRWKALHFFARNFFGAQLIGAIEDRDKLRADIHACNNASERFDGEWVCELSTTSGKVLKTLSGRCSLRPGSSKKLGGLDAALLTPSSDPRDLIIWMTLRKGGEIVARNTATFVRPKHLTLQDPGLKISSSGKLTEVTATKAPALWLFQSTDKEFSPSSNFVCLRKGDSARFSRSTGSKWKSLYELCMH